MNSLDLLIVQQKEKQNPNTHYNRCFQVKTNIHSNASLVFTDILSTAHQIVMTHVFRAKTLVAIQLKADSNNMNTITKTHVSHSTCAN